MGDPLKVYIRWLIRRDMPEVLGIERQAFGDDAWTEEEFMRCLRHRNVIGLVAEDSRQEAVVGFLLFELHKTRLHLLNFAVAAADRRRGVGRQMVEKLKRKLGPRRRARITAEVRETNLPAQKFFRSCGFRAMTILRAYYEDSGDDAYLMQFRRLEPAETEMGREEAQKTP